MSLTAKPGTRLFSAVCDGQLIVVQAPPAGIELTIGGVAPRTTGDGDVEAVHPGHDLGTAIGKRYTDVEGTVVLLCTKSGKGSPALGGVLLELKEAKPLPASD